MTKLASLTDQELQALADVIAPALAVGIKRAVHAEVEPLRQSEQRMAAKLARIEALVSGKPRKAA